MIKYLKIAIVAVSALVISSCVEGDKFDPSRDVIVMTGTDMSPLIKFAVEETPAIYPVTVSSTGKVSEDITVDIKIDNSLVEKYNAEHKTSYYSCEEDWLSLEKNTVVIRKGNASSEVSQLLINEKANFIDGRIYMIPVTITNVKGGVELLESSRTAYIRISRVYYFPALDLSNTKMYANYIFDDSQKVELPTHTVEVKFYANRWKDVSDDQPMRMLGVFNKDEKGYLYRFNESDNAVNQLQVNVSDASPMNTVTMFSLNTWYTLTVTFDGSTTRLYVDGVRDTEVADGKPLTLQRIEFGMSWAGYPSRQYCDARIAELRVWDRALSASEIQLGLCGVDPGSEGLVAYWKLNEGEGYTFNDSSANEMHMDWSHVWRCIGENDPMTEHDYSAEVRWTDDEKNRCAN